MGRSIDRTGQRYGRLLVLGQADPYVSPNGAVARRWRCLCDCGTTTEVRGSHLQASRSTSCGCFQRDSVKERSAYGGRSKSPEHNTWHNMMARCYKTSHRHFQYYGGRGIKVCTAWHDFMKFAADMGPRPKGFSLDRIDNNGDYTPENCRWVAQSAQARNTSRNVWVIYSGRRMVLADAAQQAGLSYQTVYMRRAHGWPESRWFEPVRPRGANLSE